MVCTPADNKKTLYNTSFNHVSMNVGSYEWHVKWMPENFIHSYVLCSHGTPLTHYAGSYGLFCLIAASYSSLSHKYIVARCCIISLEHFFVFPLIIIMTTPCYAQSQSPAFKDGLFGMLLTYFDGNGLVESVTGS